MASTRESSVCSPDVAFSFTHSPPVSRRWNGNRNRHRLIEHEREQRLAASTATCWPLVAADAAVPTPAPMTAPFQAPEPPSAIAPMAAPTPAPPAIFLPGILPGRSSLDLELVRDDRQHTPVHVDIGQRSESTWLDRTCCPIFPPPPRCRRPCYLLGAAIASPTLSSVSRNPENRWPSFAVSELRAFGDTNRQRSTGGNGQRACRKGSRTPSYFCGACGAGGRGGSMMM